LNKYLKKKFFKLKSFTNLFIFLLNPNIMNIYNIIKNCYKFYKFKIIKTNNFFCKFLFLNKEMIQKMFYWGKIQMNRFYENWKQFINYIKIFLKYFVTINSTKKVIELKCI